MMGATRMLQAKMSHLVITTQVYPPELHPTAVMVREFAQHMVRSGWEVTVCCGLPHHPHGHLYPGWRWKLWDSRLDDGLRLIRSGHLVHQSRSIPMRAAVYVTQAMGAAIAAASCSRVDAVMVYGPPLVGPNLGAMVARAHGAKLVNVVYDIYPDIAIETGKVTNPAFISAARVAERLQYQASDRIVVLSDGFKKTLVAKGVAADKIAVVPVWLDPDEVRPMNRDNPWRREHGIPTDSFVVLYAGTIGVVSGAAMVADAADLLRDREEILFLFVGEGEAKLAVEARVRELALTNIRFLPFQPRERLSEVQATADVGLVTLAPGRGRTSVPSKVLGYMAAGRPVLASVDAGSDTALSITANGSGRVVSPANARALADVVGKAAGDEAWLATAGASARASFERDFGRQQALEALELKLSTLLHEPAQS
jgi:putative colanic acid biosynthesis glycosyltransferase WcaI